MILVAPFRPHHLMELTLQNAQQYLSEVVAKPEYGRELSQQRDSYTVFSDAGPVMCAGIWPQWDGRGIAWALVGLNAGRYMRGLTREVTSFLDRCNYRRIEAYIDPTFKASIRWAEMLGFEREGLMRAFSETGRDQFMYARVR